MEDMYLFNIIWENIHGGHVFNVIWDYVNGGHVPI